MIPKIIHYCWFGRGPKPADALRFIDGWRRLHPDYQIIEWNEDNFDTICCQYVREAYEQRKFAFVSDYARGKALFDMGGVYLDTDVELVGRLDPFLVHEAFFGFEEGNLIATSTFGCRPGHPVVKRYLDQYASRSFVKADGSLDLTTNVTVLNQLLLSEGLRADGKLQHLADGVACYPMQCFSPLDYINFRDHRDGRTVAIHHYQHTWGGAGDKARRWLSRWISRCAGPNFLTKARRFISCFRS